LDSFFAGQIALLALAALIATVISIYAAASSHGSGRFLCDDCQFNNDDDCSKPERPEALRCTAYRRAKRTTGQIAPAKNQIPE